MILSREDLDAAVDAGILDVRARDRLVAFKSAREASGGSSEAGPDNESFRLLTGFNDIFVALACILLLVAVAALTPPAITGLAVAAAAWGLAEYFTRVRRFALPSIILLLAFVGGSFFGSLTLLGGTGFAFERLASGGGFPLALGGAGGSAVLAAIAHWFRFRVPITLAAGAAGLVVLGGVIVSQLTQSAPVLLLAMLVAGLAVFSLAMRYDIGDRQRITRATDIAFWLHLLAAPLIVHPIFALTGLNSDTPAPGAALLVLVVYLALTAVALAIDRRALLVSALVYVLWALNGLFAAGQVAAGFGLTALVLGSFLVILSAAWGSLRRRLLPLLPAPLLALLPAAG